MCSDCYVVCFPCYTPHCRSALSRQIPLTFCALFFLGFTEAGKNFAQVHVFPGIHGSFSHFCKGRRNFAQRSQQWQIETSIMMQLNSINFSDCQLTVSWHTHQSLPSVWYPTSCTASPRWSIHLCVILERFVVFKKPSFFLCFSSMHACTLCFDNWVVVT